MQRCLNFLTILVLSSAFVFVLLLPPINTVAADEKEDNQRFEELSNLADQYSKGGHYGQAELIYKQLIQKFDLTFEGYLGLYQPPFWIQPYRGEGRYVMYITTQAYPRLIKALASQNKIEEALELAEYERARSLQAVIQSRIGSRRDKHLISMSRSEVLALAKEVNKTFVVYSIVSDTEVLVWVVQPQGAIHFVSLPLHFDHPLPKDPDAPGEDDPMGQIVSAFSRSVTRGVVDTIIEAGPERGNAEKAPDQRLTLRWLYDALIAPMEPYLPTDPDANIVIIPDGPLYLVPFQALIDGENRYVVDRHTISIAPSMTIYRMLRNVQRNPPPIGKAGPSALVIGNPDMPGLPHEDGLYLPQLPGAEREAKDIASLFHVHPLIGKDAKEDIVKRRMPGARIIHFATHGLIVQSSILTFSDVSASVSTDLPPGAIALASSPAKQMPAQTPKEPDFENPTPNGFLASGKILSLHLNADLVTLSACDTARGRTGQAEFVGLPSALLAAGARSVIMTLWAIPDGPTPELMLSFYQKLLAGQGKAAALRQAILSAKQLHPAPESWAAFTLIGLAD